jgi:hypothetical protein
MKQPHLPEFEPERDFKNCDADTKAFWDKLEAFEKSITEVQERIDKLGLRLQTLSILIEGDKKQ